MSIAILNTILNHPLLLLPALKSVHMHQLFRDWLENYFMIFSTGYLPNLYDIKAPRSWDSVYSTGSPLYIPFIYLLCTLFKLKFIYMSSYMLYLSELQGPLTLESPEDKQRIYDECLG